MKVRTAVATQGSSELPCEVAFLFTIHHLLFTP